jgi:iron complex transport system substrate-binding protein
LGAAETGAALVETMKAEIETLRKTGADIQQKRTVYFEISPAPDMVTLGRKTYLHEMIEIAGGINIFENEEGIIFPSAEIVIEKNPDVILTNVDYTENVLAEIRSRPGFDRVGAVRENRIFLIDADSSSRSTQNIVKALRQMALALYPEYYEENPPR